MTEKPDWYDAMDHCDEGVTVGAGLPTIVIPEPTRDQAAYLARILAASGHDPQRVIGGPKCGPWVRLAGPNSRFNYGMRKRRPGEKLFLGNEAEHYGMQLWSISDGVATPANGNWAFVNNVHWYSLALPPAPEQPTD